MDAPSVCQMVTCFADRNVTTASAIGYGDGVSAVGYGDGVPHSSDGVPPSRCKTASRRRVVTTAYRRRINRAKRDTIVTTCKRTS